MATKTLKARIELAGESEYKRALSEINKGNQVLASELRKVQEQYKGSEKSMEALRAKSDVLERQLLSQKDKVQTLREALARSAQEYGEADKRTQEWQIQLNNAETAQIKLERQLDETNKEIEQQGEAVDQASGKMVNLGDAVQTVAGKLGIQLPEGSKKALDGMNGLSAGSVAAMGAIAAGVAAVIKVVKELNDLTLEAASRADDLLTQSMTSGISTDLLQQFQYAAPYIDVSADTMVGALKKVGLSINNAAEQFAKYDEAAQKAAAQGKTYEGALGAQAAAFDRLGVSVTDANGELRDAWDVMQETLQALSEVENQTERNAIANDLFGKSYDELAPVVQDYAKFQQLCNEAMAEGYVLSEQQLEILGEVDDAHEKYTQTLEKQTNLIAVQWAPTTKQAYEQLSDLTEKAGDALIKSMLIENFGTLVNTTLDLLDAGANLFGTMPSWLNPLELVSNALKGLAVIMATVADYADAVRGVMTLDFNKVGTALGLNASKGQLSNRQKLKYGNDWTYYEGSGWTTKNSSAAGYDSARGLYYDKNGNYIFPGSNAGGNVNWRGGLTYLHEAGPEVYDLPSGTRIYSAQESRELTGDQYITINVQGIRQLDEIVQWYESRRIRERMG